MMGVEDEVEGEDEVDEEDDNWGLELSDGAQILRS
jgi:hypothetical protein